MPIFSRLTKVGIDAYLIALLCAVAVSFVLPARGVFADVVKQASIYAVALLFFVYGAKLKSEAVMAGFSNWQLQLSIMAVTFVAFPLATITLTYFGQDLLPDDLLIGLLYIGILPSTVQSSIAFTALARGNVSAAVCAASASNLVGVAITPLLAMLILGVGDGEFNTSAAVNIGIQIVLPFAFGQIARPFIGEWINRHRLVSLSVDRGSILLIVYSAFSAGMVSGVWSQVDTWALLCAVFAVCLLLALAIVLTLGLGRTAGFSPGDQQAMLFCGSTKSLASGVPIANILFAGAPVGLIILPLMIYHQIQLVVCAIIAQRRSFRHGE